PAPGRADDRLRLVLVELGLGYLDGLAEVLVGQLRVDDGMGVPGQEGRFDAAGDRLPAVQEEDFHASSLAAFSAKPSLNLNGRILNVTPPILILVGVTCRSSAGWRRAFANSRNGGKASGSWGSNCSWPWLCWWLVA